MADGDLRAEKSDSERSESGIETNQRAVTVDKVLVWDLPVRIFHWTLVIAVIAAYVTDKLGVAYFKYHLWCGYTVLVLVAFRVVWGFIGTRHARFLSFVRGPKAIWQYVGGGKAGEAKRHWAGHNPAGAVMVIVLLGGLLVQAASGLFTNDEIFNVGPLYGYISNDLSLSLTSLHRQLFYWIVGAIGLHVAAVIGYRVFKKEKLVAAMLTGKKRDVSPDEAIETSRIYRAVAVVIVVSAILTALIMTAPIAITDVGY